jgi:hypothetical protein
MPLNEAMYKVKHILKQTLSENHFKKLGTAALPIDISIRYAMLSKHS